MNVHTLIVVWLMGLGIVLPLGMLAYSDPSRPSGDRRLGARMIILSPIWPVIAGLWFAYSIWIIVVWIIVVRIPRLIPRLFVDAFGADPKAR